MPETEYDLACNALINQKLYVDKKAGDVIEFKQHIDNRVEFLKGKKREITDQISWLEKHADRAKSALTGMLIASGERKMEVEEYVLSLRSSKSVVIDNLDKVPYKYQSVIVEMPMELYKRIENEYGKQDIKEIKATKTAIKTALENGETVDGARFSENENLQIKD